MDKNTLIIGGAIIVVGGAIATGAFLNNPDLGSGGKKSDDNISQGIEDDILKDFADENRYSFCQGHEEIKGPYTSSVFGKEEGNIEYISDDISVFDKEKNKLFILGRKIKYKYSGTAEMLSSAGEGTVNIEESGMTTEYYDKYSAPIRIDYNAKIINPAPERKRNDWVVIETKGKGTVMGFTQERDDKEMGDAKTFCPAFSLTNAFITPEYFSFEKSCDGGSGVAFHFDGNFKFECGGIDSERGIELIKEYKESEKLMQEFNSISDEDSQNEFDDVIKDNDTEDKSTQEKLQDLRNEMKQDGVQ